MIDKQIYDELFVISKFFVINDENIFEQMLQIYQRIEQERISAGLTQEQMAEKLGIERSTYQYWEKKTPSTEKIIRVAKALGLPEDYFFVSKDENSNGSQSFL